MKHRSRFWLALAVVFAAVNLGGAAFAAAMGDPLHAAAHAVLLLPATYLVWRLAAGRRGGAWVDAPDEAPGLSDRLSRLEQAVDTVAVEVGRMGDGQRFMTNFFTENASAGADRGAKPHTSDS